MLNIVKILYILIGLLGVASLALFIYALVRMFTQRKQPTEPQAAESVATICNARSYFDGNTWQLIGIRLLSGLLTGITLGLAYPWAMCMSVRWEVKHTVINGRRLRFTGNGAQLFGNT